MRVFIDAVDGGAITRMGEGDYNTLTRKLSNIAYFLNLPPEKVLKVNLVKKADHALLTAGKWNTETELVDD